MKKIIILFLLMSYCLVAQENFMPELDFDNFTNPFSSGLKGKAKYSEVKLYELKFLKIKKIIASRTTEFNVKGDFTKDALSGRKEIESEVVRVFDRNGHLSKEVFCFRQEAQHEPPFDKKKYEMKCLYIDVRTNATGLVLEKKYFGKDSTLEQSMKWKYDAKGKIRREEIYNGNNKFIRRTDISYNNGGQVVSRLYYFNDTVAVNEKIIYHYDKNDSLSETETYTNAGKSPDQIIKYDKGKIWEEYSYNDQKQISKRINYYDALGNLIKQEEKDGTENVTRQSIYLNKYDSKNRLIETIGKDTAGKMISRRKLAYDENDNWISIKLFINGKKYFIKRTIVYIN